MTWQHKRHGVTWPHNVSSDKGSRGQFIKRVIAMLEPAASSKNYENATYSSDGYVSGFHTNAPHTITVYGITNESDAGDSPADYTGVHISLFHADRSVMVIACFVGDVHTRRAILTAVLFHAHSTEVAGFATRVQPDTASRLATLQPVRSVEGSVRAFAAHDRERKE